MNENLDPIRCKPNSYKSKEEQKASSEKKIEKVVQGEVKTKKKSEIQKLGSIFISEDVNNVKDYILMDVLVPSIKNAIYELVTGSLDMIFFNGQGRLAKKSQSSTVSYSRYYDQKRDTDRGYSGTRTATGYDYNDIILETRGEAEDVLDRMSELIDTYGQVTVADLYDLVGITGNYTDNKYGWVNIRNAEPIRVRNGYLLKLPKAIPVD